MHNTRSMRAEAGQLRLGRVAVQGWQVDEVLLGQVKLAARVYFDRCRCYYEGLVGEAYGLLHLLQLERQRGGRVVVGFAVG